MNEWYFPITILPAVALIIMSTTQLSSNLSIEISELVSKNCEENKETIQLKILQLTRLSYALTLLYLSSATLVLSGLINGLAISNRIFTILLYLSVIFILCALVLLIIYAIYAVSIKKNYFRSKL